MIGQDIAAVIGRLSSDSLKGLIGYISMVQIAPFMLVFQISRQGRLQS